MFDSKTHNHVKLYTFIFTTVDSLIYQALAKVVKSSETCLGAFSEMTCVYNFAAIYSINLFGGQVTTVDNR